MWQGPSPQSLTGPLHQRSSCTAAGVFITLQSHVYSITLCVCPCVCEENLITVAVCNLWFCLNSVRSSFQTNADLLTLAVSMAKCKSVDLPSTPVPIRLHSESQFCLFHPAALARHCGAMNPKESRQNQDPHQNRALCESHLCYDLTFKVTNCMTQRNQTYRIFQTVNCTFSHSLAGPATYTRV